ncbi:hypothetical protein [Nocardioides convexus]|uniref:hypothetical protein n=1 Tax=Nocardioides convexus TaxID=2712224 RepID=UPI0024186B55|nr:hypothetical protein [Nocardioides convexus]
MIREPAGRRRGGHVGRQAPRPSGCATASRCAGWSRLVDPLDRALRSTRVLVRQTSIAAYRRRPVPASYAVLAADLADAADAVADEPGRRPAGRHRPRRRARRRCGDRGGRAQRGAHRRGDPGPACARSSPTC